MSRVAVVSAVGLGALGLVSGVAAAVVTEAADSWGYSGYAAMPLDSEIAVFYAAMGLLVTWRKPRNLVGWALLSIAAWDGVVALMTALVGAFDSVDNPVVQTLMPIQHGGWAPPIWAIATLLPLIYPDGRLPSRHLWWAVGFAGLGIVMYVAGITLSVGYFGAGPYTVVNPAAVPEWADFTQFMQDAGEWMLLAASGVALVTLAIRWWRATGVQARRLSLLFWALMFGAAQAGIREVVEMPQPVHHILEVVAAALVPMAVAVAVTRDRLYDLDLAIRRAVVTVAVVVSLLACYLGLYVVLDLVRPNPSAFEAGLVGAAVFPVALLLTRWVRQVAWGRRVDIANAVTGLGQRMRDRLTIPEVPAAVCEEIVGSLGLRFARLELETSDGVRTLAEVRLCEAEAEPVTFDLWHRGTVVGRMVVAPPEGREHLDEMTVQALASLADQVAPVVAALRLDEELLRSREQLVTAREEERLRLSRDLHDDVGPTLAGIRLQLDAVRARLPEDAPALELMDRAVIAIQDALGIVRRVAYRLRPPELDTLGLVGALRELSVFLSAPTFKVEAVLPEDVSSLSKSVEVAAYRIVAEALTNVVKHAQATAATVRLVIDDRGVVVEVEDNGVGFPQDANSRGMGLKFMAQRAQEISGEFSRRTTEAGSLVRAVLPLNR